MIVAPRTGTGITTEVGAGNTADPGTETTITTTEAEATSETREYKVYIHFRLNNKSDRAGATEITACTTAVAATIIAIEIEIGIGSKTVNVIEIEIGIVREGAPQITTAMKATCAGTNTDPPLKPSILL